MSSAPVRVLEMLTSSAIGGGPKQVYDLVTRLPRAELTPLIAAPRDGSYFERFREAGVNTVELPLNRLWPRTLVRVIRLIRNERADIVHSHGKGAGLYGRLAAAWTGVPAVHTFHGIHYGRYAQGVDALYLGLERWLSRFTRVIINVSESQAREGAALRLFRPGQGVVIVNGVDVAEIDRLTTAQPIARASLGIGPDRLVVGCVTRFDQVKATASLLEAVRRLVARVPGIQLVLVGGGAEERGLRARVAAGGLAGHVTFLNFLPRAPRALPMFDVYVSASHREGLPLAVLEAMAAGLPVVATRVAGHVDAVEHDVTGLLSRPDDIADLAEKVACLLGDAALRQRMGAAGRQRIERLFSADRMVAQTAAVYLCTAGARPATADHRPAAPSTGSAAQAGQATVEPAVVARR